MQPMFKSTERERRSYRPQPLEPVRRNRPWVVPVALAVLIVFLLVALVALAQQVPSSPYPPDQSTVSTTPFNSTP